MQTLKSLLRKGGLPCEMASSNPVIQPRHALPEYASLSLRPWDTSVTTAKAPFGLVRPPVGLPCQLVSVTETGAVEWKIAGGNNSCTEGYFKKAKQTPNKHYGVLSV
jgi:hypothetical protein